MRSTSSNLNTGVALLSKTFMRTVPFAILLTALSSASLPAANLVANGDFETGNLSNWTLSGCDSSPAYNGIDYGVDQSDARSGAYGAYLGGFGGVLALTQTFVTTGKTSYTVSFWLAQIPAPSRLS